MLPVTLPAVNWLAAKIEHWPIERLLPYANNARTHSEQQVAQIAASIVAYGFVNPCLVGSDGALVAGHGCLLAARSLQLPAVPVAVLDHLNPLQRRALVLADNRTAELTSWDDELLRLELQALEEDGFDLDLTGFDADALAELLEDEEPQCGGAADDDAVPEVAEVTVSQRGGVWLLGEHKLLCGDATIDDSYRQLLQQERVQLIWSDPPHSVNYANTAKDRMRGTAGPILNDNLGEGFYDFLHAALSHMLPRCNGALYIAMSSSLR